MYNCIVRVLHAKLQVQADIYVFPVHIADISLCGHSWGFPVGTYNNWIIVLEWIEEMLEVQSHVKPPTSISNFWRPPKGLNSICMCMVGSSRHDVQPITSLTVDPRHMVHLYWARVEYGSFPYSHTSGTDQCRLIAAQHSWSEMWTCHTGLNV